MPKLEKYHKALDYSYAPGLFPCMEALTKQTKFVSKVLISERIDTKPLQMIQEAIEGTSIRIEKADRVLQTLSGKENCFAAAIFKKHETLLRDDTNHIVLHSISDKGNLGTILRTALGFSFLDIAIIAPACDPFDPQVIRASMGAFFSARVKQFKSFEEYENNHNNRQLYPLMLGGSVHIEEAVKAAIQPFSLIMGNEGSGLPEFFSKKGIALRIPHSNKIDSLNLSIASSIAMYLFSKFNL